jgi:GntR family transcriptional regulator / MocR family aminotransferase
MSRSGLAVSPILKIDRSLAVPLHKQVYDGYRTAIVRGELRPGQVVLSSRELAIELQVSRFPVLHAYGQLTAEGYLESRVGSGTYISSSLPEQLLSVRKSRRSTAKSPSGPRPIAQRSLLYQAFDPFVLRQGWGAFGVHQPALDEFPFKLWSSLVYQHSKNPNANAIHNINPFGLEHFREAICAHLRTSRGVQCQTDQIMIVSGSQQALDITANVLLDPGNQVWIEEPGYYLGRAVIQGAGCRLVPIPVDEEGMDISYAIKKYRKARAALVTPSHQYPLGSTMTARRRLELLNWAQSSGSWIIEDDYDSEYRFETSPIASLQGLDLNARVIYIGTFSKVLFPAVRIGYIVIPPDLVDRFVAVRYSMDIFPPYLMQEVLADFMSHGHFGAHIRKMRQLYRERRTVLVKSIQSIFGNQFEVHGAEAGMHLTVTLPDHLSDLDISERASMERLWLRPLSPAYITKRARQGLILGFGSTSAKQIPHAVERMRVLIGSQ